MVEASAARYALVEFGRKGDGVFDHAGEFLVVGLVGVEGPFPGVSVHVVKSPGVWLFTGNRIKAEVIKVAFMEATIFVE